MTGATSFVGAEEDDNGNGTDAGGVFALPLDDPDAPVRPMIPEDGGPRSYLGFTLATTDRLLAASEDTEVRLFQLDQTAAGTVDGQRLSTSVDRSLTSGVLALAGDGHLLVVGMPYDDGPVREAGTVLLVEWVR